MAMDAEDSDGWKQILRLAVAFVTMLLSMLADLVPVLSRECFR